MNLKKYARCHIRMESRFASYAGVCMGISVFLRTIYYFGLTNLRDLGTGTVAVEIVVPLVLAFGYLTVVSGFRFNAPPLMGGMIGVYGLWYLIRPEQTMASLVVGVLLVIMAVVFLATALGYLPNRIPVICCGVALGLVQVYFVDISGWIFPLAEFNLIEYLPKASDLFGVLAMALLPPALRLTRRNTPGVKAEPFDLVVVPEEVSAPVVEDGTTVVKPAEEKFPVSGETMLVPEEPSTENDLEDVLKDPPDLGAVPTVPETKEEA